MANRRNQNNNSYYNRENPFSDVDHGNEKSQHYLERKGSQYYGDHLYKRSVESGGNYYQDGMHSEHDQDYDDHRQNRYTYHQQRYDRPFNASYGENRSSIRETSRLHGDHPREYNFQTRRKNRHYRTERKSGHLGNYHIQSTEEHAELASMFGQDKHIYDYENNKCRQSADVSDECNNHSYNVKKYKDRVTYEKEDNQSFHQKFAFDSNDLYRHDYYTYTNRGDAQDHDRGERAFGGWADAHSHGRHETGGGAQYSEEETENRSFLRISSSSLTSSHQGVYDYRTESRVPHGSGKQPRSYSTETFRETQNEKYYASPIVKKRDPLIKETPVSDERVGTKRESVGLLRIPSQSSEDGCTNVPRGLLPTPNIEVYNNTVKSACLLSSETEIDSSLQKTNQHSVPIENQRGGLVCPSSGLLPTPTVSPFENFNDVSTDMISAPKWNEDMNPDSPNTDCLNMNIIPSPACTPFNEAFQSAIAPAEKEIETVIYHTKGLLPTLKSSPTVFISGQPSMQNAYSIDESVKYHDNTELVESENTLSSGSERIHFEDNRKNIAEDVITGNGILSRISQDDGFIPNEKSVSFNVKNDKTIPNNEKKMFANVAGRPEQSTVKQVIENIQVQIQLAEALECMQKTMQTLQKKIHEDQVAPNDAKETSTGNEKFDSLRKVENNVFEFNEDQDCVEIIDEVEGIVSDNPVNKLSEYDNKSAGVPHEVKENNESEQILKTEFDNGTYKKKSASNESHAIRSSEQCDSTENQSKELMNELFRIQTNKSRSRREFKTYKEWRLAKERMNKYFYKKGSEREDGARKDIERVQNLDVKNLYNRNDSSSPNGSNHGKVNDPKHLNDKRSRPIVGTSNCKHSENTKPKEMIDFKDPGYGSVTRKELDCRSSGNISKFPKEAVSISKHCARQDIGITDICSEDRMQDELGSEGIDDKTLKQLEESKQERKNKNSYQIFSNDLDKHQRKHYDKPNSSYTHRLPRLEISTKYHIQDKSNFLEGKKHNEKAQETKRERNLSDNFSQRTRLEKSEKDKSGDDPDDNRKQDSSHRHRHYSSDSLSRLNSKEVVKHIQDWSKSQDNHLERSGKYKSSITENSHRHHHKKRHYSTAEEKDNLQSTLKLYHSAKGKECYDTRESSVKIDLNQITNEIRRECSSQKDIEHKIVTREKGNLFENLAMENEIIDVVSGISTSEEKDQIVTTPQLNGVERNLKKVFVKLYDINKFKEQNTNRVKTIENETKGNIFEEMSSKIFSLEGDKTRAKADGSKYQKDAMQSDSTTAVQTVKKVMVGSEDSSSEIDPFEKMNAFLNKDKRNPSLSLKEPKVLGSSVLQKSTKRFDDFIVSDDHVLDLEGNISSKFKHEETPQNTSYGSKNKSKEFVKHLKRVNNTLYWKKIKLIFPRINLQRLKRSEIKRLKSKLKESKKHTISIEVKGKSVYSDKNAFENFRDQKHVDKTAKLDKDIPVEIKTGVIENTKQDRKINAETNVNQATRFKLKSFSLSLNRLKWDEYANQKIDKYSDSADNLSDKTTDLKDTSPSRSLECAKTKNKLGPKTNVSVSVEGKQSSDDQNYRKYKRIASVKCSSTEQSESSDIERIVCVSQREKLRPVIFDSDESEELEGSLGSEDSTCFDITDESEGKKSPQTNEDKNELVIDGTVSDSEFKSDLQVINRNLSSVAKVETENSASLKGAVLPVFENKKKLEIIKNCSSKEEGLSKSQTTHAKKQQFQCKRNIFADIKKECSTSETESSTSYSSKQIEIGVPGKNTIVRSSGSLVKVSLTLGKTLKKLKMENCHAHSSEESTGPDFCCLPVRKAVLHKLNLNDSSQSESSLMVENCLDEIDGIKNNELVPCQSIPKNDKNYQGDSGTEKTRNDHDTMTCSESAGKIIKRQKFDDSSTDTSDDEQLIKSKSAIKCRKRQSEKSNSGKNVNKQDSKNEIKETQKRSGTGDLESWKPLPFKSKRLFRSATQTKRQVTIMQMDGNADRVCGPPDESSGEEGDVEDNITCINVDSENESSSSQDLFENLLDRLKLLSQKQLTGPSYPGTGNETEVNDKNIVFVIDNGEASAPKSHKESHNSYATTRRDNDVTEIEIENCNDSIRDDKVKNEPDWLKFGYTQELDTIFLSDDDEMVMSVSQPVILVSDEETQNPDSASQPVCDNVKQEKIDYDEKLGTVDTACENYSSAEDWSDKGSDFEPENMFNSLQRAHNENAVAENSEHNSSEGSLFSDDDLFRSQSLLEPNIICNKNDGFESGDCAIDEDELLGSPVSDDTSISIINEDELLEMHSTIKEKNRRVVIQSEIQDETNKYFSQDSDSDDILFKTTIEFETQLWKKTSRNLLLEPVCQNSKNGLVNRSINVEADADMIESSQKFDLAKINKNKNRGSVDSECKAFTPYVQETQVDPNISDEDTSNSVTAFDFYSEHFADSDTDINAASMTNETEKNSPKHLCVNKYDYETLSDDSDIMILDNPTNDNEVKTKTEKFLKEKEKTRKEIVIQTDAEDEISEFNGLIQDKHAYQTHSESTQSEGENAIKSWDFDKRSKGSLHDIYFTDTQVEKPGQSSSDIQTNVKKSRSSLNSSQRLSKISDLDAYDLQTQIATSELSIYKEQTRIDNKSAAFGEQMQTDNLRSTEVQLDTAGPSYVSATNLEDLKNMSDDSVSDTDPQLKSYFQKSPFDKNAVRDKRFFQSLKMIFDSFSDSGEDEMRDEYETLTGVDTKPKHKKMNRLKRNRKGLKMIAVEKSIGNKKEDYSAYNVLTQSIFEDSEESDDYGAMTQVDPVANRDAVAIAHNKKQQKAPLDDNAYFAATQFENISEPENEEVVEDRDLYFIATQINAEDDKEWCEDETKKSPHTVRNFNVGKKDIFEDSDGDYNRLNRDTFINSHVNKSAYTASTQSNNDDIREPEEQDKEEDFYNTATQRDVNNIKESNFENIFLNDEKSSDKHKTAESKQDDNYDSTNVYCVETPDDELPDIVPASGETEDLFMVATQVDSANVVCSNKNVMSSVIKGRYSAEMTKQKSVLGTKSILKRTFPESTSDKTVSFGPISESTATKKTRVSERKILEIQPQKLKSTAEKKASGVVTGSSEPQNSVSSLNIASSNLDIEVLDIPKSCMSLSKKVVAKKILGRGKEADKIGKRKRRESADEDLRARMMAARTQLKERSMHSITHPDAIKRMKTGPTATVTTSELEDVTLPTDSQIIKQGLPLLNSTGVLLKTHMPVSDTNEKLSDALNIAVTVPESLHSDMPIAAVSTATTTICTSVSASMPYSVQTTSASVASTVQHRVSETGKDQKSKMGLNENDKTKDKARTIEDSVRPEKGSKEAKPDKEKFKPHDRERRHKERHHHSESGGGGTKDNLNRKRNESGNSDKRGKVHRGRYTDKENNKFPVRSDDGSTYHESYVDSKLCKDKHGKKKDIKKQSNAKDNRQGLDSGQKKERERNSSSKQSESKKRGRDSREKSGEYNQKTQNCSDNKIDVTTSKRSVEEKDASGYFRTIPAVSTCIATACSSTVTVSNTINVTTPSVCTSGERYVNKKLVNEGKLVPKVIKIVTTATTTTTASLSRNTAKSSAIVRTTTSTHIQSSVLLQKQSGKPATASTSGPHPTPSAIVSGRQPFQPLISNIPGSVEPMPSNMVGNVKNFQWNDFLKVILKWSPNWFEEREKMEQTNKRAPPPDVTNDLFGHSNLTLYPLLERYENFKEYSEKFMLPLLLHETWESCYSTWRKNKQRLCKHILMFSHQAQGGKNLLVYTLIGLISERDKRCGNYVSEGDLVKVTINGDLKVSDTSRKNMDYTMSGFIDKVTFKDFHVERICVHYREMAEVRKQLGDCVSMKLIVRVRFRSFIPNDKTAVHLESVSTIINTWRQFTALSCLPGSPLCRDLLYPTGNLTYCDKAPAMVSGLQDNYNKSQLTAINTAARIFSLPREAPRVCLLQGPPGTGKSHTIVGIIKYLVKVSGGQCCICLCAPSHAAVDELLRRLIKYNKTVDKNATIKMVRLGKKNSVHTDIQSYCLDSLVQRNIVQAQKEELLKQLPQSLQGERTALENKIIMFTKNIEKAKDQFQRQKLRLDLKKLERQKEVLESKYVLPKTNVDPQQERKTKSDLLLRAHVIAGTLSSIGSNVLRAEFQKKPGLAFQVVIIDEATQAIELETLIPLQYGITKIILVGDPEQLPATVLSQVATDNKFNMSLFERLDSHFRYKEVNPVILLDTQYRMDPEISAFPNKYVYNGRIQDDRCVVERSQLPLVPYLLFDVCEGRELFSQGTRSMCNPLEAVFTAELCKFIVTQSSVIEKVIGIIAPYANQKQEILKELGKRRLNAIEVSTVDGFQGREKHLIVMSCVRANTCGTVGFVGNRNRMNVSLTRAKYAMYLVGHFEALELNITRSSDEWKALIADARQRRKIIPVNQSSMKQAIKKIIQQ